MAAIVCQQIDDQIRQLQKKKKEKKKRNEVVTKSRTCQHIQMHKEVSWVE
jgi:hypothetical protein